GGILADGGQDPPAAAVDGGPPPGATCRASGAVVQPGARGGGGGVGAPRDDHLPALFSGERAGPLLPAPEAVGSQVPAASPPELRLPLAGRAAPAGRRAGLVCGAAVEEPSGPGEALLRRRGGSDAAGARASGAGPAPGRAASGIRPVRGRPARVRGRDDRST